VRWLTLTLVALIALLQYSLWLGKGSWLKVWELDQKLAAQRETNKTLQARNASLDAEVRDLKQGFDAIEERARSELGMVKRDEVFFQVLEDNKQRPTQPSASSPPASTPATGVATQAGIKAEGRATGSDPAAAHPKP
jgi:cell division protein FtsB